MEWIKINCECGKVKKLIFKDHILSKREERELAIEMIESGNRWTDGKIPPITDFCKGSCYKSEPFISLNKILIGTDKYENF